METERKTMTEIGELSAAERNMVLRMRSLKPYMKIEVKLVDGRISIISTSNVREDFPIDG